MVKNILLIFFMLFAISGICEFIHSIRLFAFNHRRMPKPISIVGLKSGSAYLQLKYICEQRHWLGDRFAKYIIAIDPGLEGEESEECRIFAQKNSVILCPVEVVENVISSIVQDQRSKKC